MSEDGSILDRKALTREMAVNEDAVGRRPPERPPPEAEDDALDAPELPGAEDPFCKQPDSEKRVIRPKATICALRTKLWVDPHRNIEPPIPDYNCTLIKSLWGDQI